MLIRTLYTKPLSQNGPSVKRRTVLDIEDGIGAALIAAGDAEEAFAAVGREMATVLGEMPGALPQLVGDDVKEEDQGEPTFVRRKAK